MIETLWGTSDQYIRLRYETFIQHPSETVKQILQFVNEEASDLSFLENQTVRLKPNHNVSGNPNRFYTGEVSLKVDNQWESKMRQRDKVLVDLLFPFLWHYGYGWSKPARD